MQETEIKPPNKKNLIEGEDYYRENNLMVLTAKFLLDRGYCCGNECRHCPYPKSTPDKSK